MAFAACGGFPERGVDGEACVGGLPHESNDEGADVLRFGIHRERSVSLHLGNLLAAFETSMRRGPPNCVSETSEHLEASECLKMWQTKDGMMTFRLGPEGCRGRRRGWALRAERCKEWRWCCVFWCKGRNGRGWHWPFGCNEAIGTGEEYPPRCESRERDVRTGREEPSLKRRNARPNVNYAFRVHLDTQNLGRKAWNRCQDA